MSIGDDKQRKDLEELQRIYSLKDPRTPSGSLTTTGCDWSATLRDIEKTFKN
jgi:hypothetical protein